MAGNEDWAIPVFERAKSSVCFVMIAPRTERIAEIEDLVRQVDVVKKDDQTVRSSETRASTGFFVGSMGSRLLILTTAHSIDHVYKGTMPISETEAERLFETSILCDHYEFAYRAAGLATRVKDMREYVSAVIIGINCQLDLLLIAVERSNIKRHSSDRMCAGIHQALQISRNLEIVGEKSMLLSWLLDKHRRVATGCVGVRRNVREVSRPNNNEYSMEILEVNITSENGSSGGPLFNKSGEVIGVLHGGFGNTHSYFIPSDLVFSFLSPYVTPSDQRSWFEVDKKRKVKDIVREGKRSGNQH